MARSYHYTTRTRFDGLHGSDLALALLDLDRDGVEDAGVFDRYREQAENLVDRKLRQIYDLSVESTGDAEADPSTLTDEGLGDFTDRAIYMLLVERWRPGGEEATSLRKRFEDEVKAHRKGEEEFKSIAKVGASGGELSVRVSSRSSGTVFAGKKTDGTTPKMRGF